MSRSLTSAQTAIDSLMVQQANEQNRLAGLRARGITEKPLMKSSFYILIQTLQINQVCTILTPEERDKIIDYLMP